MGVVATPPREHAGAREEVEEEEEEEAGTGIEMERKRAVLSSSLTMRMITQVNPSRSKILVEPPVCGPPWFHPRTDSSSEEL